MYTVFLTIFYMILCIANSCDPLQWKAKDICEMALRRHVTVPIGKSSVVRATTTKDMSSPKATKAWKTKNNTAKKENEYEKELTEIK